MGEFIKCFPKLERIILDGTEPPIQRSRDREKQKADYSSKKKRHTRIHVGAAAPSAEHQNFLVKPSGATLMLWHQDWLKVLRNTDIVVKKKGCHDWRHRHETVLVRPLPYVTDRKREEKASVDLVTKESYIRCPKAIHSYQKRAYMNARKLGLTSAKIVVDRRNIRTHGATERWG